MTILAHRCYWETLMPSRLQSLVLALLLFAPLTLAAADWPQFRGPEGAGVSAEKGLPTTWTAASGVKWKTPLPGKGASSPIVFKDRIYLTCYTGYGQSEDNAGDPAKLVRHILCLEVGSGKQVWQADFPTKGAEDPYQSYQALHGFASSTLATDGQAIYGFFGRDGVVAVDMEGKTLWQTSVGTKTHGWGSATSPLLSQDLVIVNASVESDSLVALNKKTGKETWRAGGIRMSWATPALVAANGRNEVVVSVEKQLLAFDAASGKSLWSCEGVKDYVCPTVVSRDGVVYAIGGRSGAAIAVKAGGTGDVTQSQKLWTVRKGSNVSSPTLFGDYMFWVHESRGTAYCVNAKSGEVVYEERLEPRPGLLYASPLIADGKIYIVSRDAGTFVLEAGAKFKLISHNKPLDPSVFNGSPVPVDGKLLLRSDAFLYCIGS